MILGSWRWPSIACACPRDPRLPGRELLGRLSNSGSCCRPPPWPRASASASFAVRSAGSPHHPHVTVRSLEHNSLISRTLHPVVPRPGGFTLTPLGESLLQAATLCSGPTPARPASAPPHRYKRRTAVAPHARTDPWREGAEHRARSAHALHVSGADFSHYAVTLWASSSVPSDNTCMSPQQSQLSPAGDCGRSQPGPHAQPGGWSYVFSSATSGTSYSNGWSRHRAAAPVGRIQPD